MELKNIDEILKEFKDEILELANRKKYANIELTASINLVNGIVIERYNIKVNKSGMIK